MNYRSFIIALLAVICVALYSQIPSRRVVRDSTIIRKDIKEIDSLRYYIDSLKKRTKYLDKKLDSLIAKNKERDG